MKTYLVIFTIIMILFLAVFFTVYDSNKISKLHEEYKKPETRDFIQGVITDLYTEKGAAFVTIDSLYNIFLTTSRNEAYTGKNIYLYQMLSIGDTLVKEKGTNSLIIRKNEGIYYYVIGKSINYSPTCEDL